MCMLVMEAEMALKRLQVLLEPDQAKKLDERARVTGRSKSDLVREAVAVVLLRPAPAAFGGAPGDEEADPPHWKDDPFFSLIGAFEDTATDVSVNHDTYLYGAEMKV